MRQWHGHWGRCMSMGGKSSLLRRTNAESYRSLSLDHGLDFSKLMNVSTTRTIGAATTTTTTTTTTTPLARPAECFPPILLSLPPTTPLACPAECFPPIPLSLPPFFLPSVPTTYYKNKQKKVLVWNYPGQAFSEWREQQLLNNEYLSTILQYLLLHLGRKSNGGTGKR